MSAYVVKIGFWLRAGACPRAGPRPDPRDSVTIEAANQTEVIAKARAAAKTAMDSHADLEAIDTDERRQGVIVYVDRLGPGFREAVAEDVAFDDDRIDPPS